MALTVLAALAGVVAWISSARVTAEKDRIAREKDRALERFQTESRTAISAADARAAEANSKAATAVEGTAKANERTAALELEAAAVQKDLAAQQERAANAERELLELKRDVAPRRLIGEQRGKFIAALKADPHRGELVILYVAGDGETGRYAADIADAISAVDGWSVKPSPLMTVATWGLGIEVQDQNNAPLRAVALAEALNAAGIAFGVISLSGTAPDEVFLLIGTKPPR